ncbi:MAG TPA: DUF2550 domain-containing protein [Pseudonocardiaceae bacterium]|jgi:hypothetical protein|nr:DUF2550 domain-containing protein [Pseudonocardiaceae bacterium]
MDVGQIVWWVLLAGVLLVLVRAVRRIRLVRSGGIDVALRLRPDDGLRGWRQGVGHYHGDDFSWFRFSSLRAGPDRVLDRDRLQVVERRCPTLPESYVMPTGAVVLRCRTDLGDLELAMRRDTLTGFLSWLESAPPGRKPGL